MRYSDDSKSIIIHSKNCIKARINFLLFSVWIEVFLVVRVNIVSGVVGCSVDDNYFVEFGSGSGRLAS